MGNYRIAYTDPAAGDIGEAGRVCFFAHYHPHDLVEDYVLTYLTALREEGFHTVVLSTAKLSDADVARLSGCCAQVVLRENVGLDFGGWIDACQMYPDLSAELLLLANDSVYAPIGDLGGFIDDLTAVPADFYGAVESIERRPHLQSWFLLLRPAAYRSPAFAGLLGRPMPPGLSKMEIIDRYEVGLTQALVAQGLQYHAFYSPRTSGWIANKRPFNAPHLLWKQLIEDGLPFLKVELLRDNPVRVLNLSEWTDVVRARAPRLAEQIRQDAETRKFSGEGRWRHEHWYWSLHVEHSSYWPEMRRFLDADHRRSGRVVRSVRTAAYLFIEFVGLRLRPILKARVERRDAARSR